MKHCPYCKVDIGGDPKKCPLCQSKCKSQCIPNGGSLTNTRNPIS